MCLMVWLGSERPLATTDPSSYGDPSEPEAAIRRQLPSAVVSYVGSHEGCGCGFNSAELDGQGFEEEADLAPLVDALRDDERETYRAERASRERLHAIVTAALLDGPVTVHACWADDEGVPPVAVEAVDAGWLLTRTSPLREGVQYRVAGGLRG